MAGGCGNYYNSQILNALLGGTAMTIPGTWWAALMSVAPSDTGGGTELSGLGYSRVAITNNTSNFPAATSVSGTETLTTGASITWGPSSGTWAAATTVAFYDASTGGNLGPWGNLAVSVTVLSGQSLVVTAANGVFTMS